MAIAISGISGYVGWLFGHQQLRLQWQHYKPAVVLNQQSPRSSQVDFSQFWTVWDKLSAEYVDKSALDPQKMVDGAISGMVAALGDPYTVYLPKKLNDEAKADLNGSFEGVGIQLGFKDSNLAVMAPVDGTPAFKAGVKSGDLIVHIKDAAKKVDRSTEGMTIPEAVALIRGPKGTPVTLTFIRLGKTEPWEVTLMRDTIVVKSAAVEFLNPEGVGQVAHLKLNRFGDRTQEEWGAAVNQIIDHGVSKIVLDLRNNPGGYLDGAVYIAGEFLTPGKLVVSSQYGDGNKVDMKVNRSGRLLKQKLVVLVKEGSASAAEILAGAVQDHKRAKIVGIKSFGKGSVQQPDDFPNGAGIHITIAKWLRPSGEWIDKKGIVPDVEVKAEPATASATPASDVQLQKAIDYIL